MAAPSSVASVRAPTSTAVTRRPVSIATSRSSQKADGRIRMRSNPLSPERYSLESGGRS